MNFAQAWDVLAIGALVTVSDGRPAPTNQGGLPWKIWVSHNFTGELIGFGDDPVWRSMRFQLPTVDGVSVAYDILEAVEHSFEPA